MPKFKFKGFWKNMFSIEQDVDITDDTAMLYRRNIVVKNIIFFSNMIYTGIFALLSFGTPSNWVMTIILLPLSFVVNHTLNNLILHNEHDMIKQQIASYFCVFYMFLLAIVLYVKMMTGTDAIYRDSSYILIYYSLVVISLYQSPKMIKNISTYLLALVTILHFIITYDIIHKDYATNLMDFFKKFFVSDEFKDIILRTIMLGAFMIVLYAITYMGNRIQEQRKQELLKRKNVQKDFTKVVIDMFDVTLSDNQIKEDEHIQAPLLEMMSRKLASIVGLTPDEIEQAVSYSTIHLKGKIDLDVENIEDQDEQFEKLRVQTGLGNIIVKRLELRRKRDDIIRAHEEGGNSELFINKTKEIQNDRISQIVLLCDLYITLRSPKIYKRPLSHKVSMERITNDYKIYFDFEIIDRFNRFSNDFDEIYGNFKE
ncbi:MAG: hypothetical protein ACI35W_02785 [Anaeroplasmataceae bacterium]